MLQATTLLRTSMHISHGNFPGCPKQYPQLFLLTNLSITIKSNQFVGKRYRASYFLKKQKRVNS